MQKLKNNEARPKFTVFIKKKPVRQAGFGPYKKIPISALAFLKV